jgi:integrase
MPGSVWITRRKTTRGERRYVVRYRRGGRFYPQEWAGSFKTERDARTRRDRGAGEIAAGRDPRAVVVLPDPTPTLSFSAWVAKFLASRIDVDATTISTYGAGLRNAEKRFRGKSVDTITVDAVAEWLTELAAVRSPATVRLYLGSLRLLLDYAGRDPNPARDKRIKLPKRVRQEVQPPSAEHFRTILSTVSPRYRLPLLVLKQGGLRVGEAVSLTWGDVDAAGSRLRLRAAVTKRDRARWVPLPGWLIGAIEETCPLEDRTPERKVFQGLTETNVYRAMMRACRNAGIPHYTPHDPRHRRITLWHTSGVPARELAERAGHARASMSLDVYSHVMPPDEVAPDLCRSLLTP